AAVAVGCAALLGSPLALPAATASALRAGSHGPTASQGSSASRGYAGRFDRPQAGFAPAGTMLRDGSPASVGLDPAPIREVLQQVERGAIRLEDPVATYLPEFAAHGKGASTVRQLLTHTSGLQPGLPLWRDWPDRASRIAAVLDVAPTSPAGTTYVYSDLNL